MKVVSKFLSGVVIASVVAAPLLGISAANAQTATTPAPATQMEKAPLKAAEPTKNIVTKDANGKVTEVTTPSGVQHSKSAEHSKPAEHSKTSQHAVDASKHKVNPPKADTTGKQTNDSVSAPAKVEKKS